MRAASDADFALFVDAVDIDIAWCLTRLKAIELGLLAPLFFDALGADALGRRPFLTQIKRQPQAKKGGDGGADQVLNPMVPYVLDHMTSLWIREQDPTSDG